MWRRDTRSKPFLVRTDIGCLCKTYLDFFVLDGEEDDDGEAGDDDALEDEEDGPEDPVEAGDAGRVVVARLAAGRALQALERVLHVVLALLALKEEEVEAEV